MPQPLVVPFDLAALVSSEQARLLRIARRLGFDAEEARDLVQATFADAYERRAQLRDAARAAGWLRQILVSRAMGALRRQRLKKQLWGWLLPESARASAPDEQLEAGERWRTVSAEVARLPDQQRMAIALRYGEGLSVEEIAEALGITHGTARVHLHRALAKLKSIGGRDEL